MTDTEVWPIDDIWLTTNRVAMKIPRYGDEPHYRLKSTVDAERAADSKIIAALAGALERINNARHADNARGIKGLFVPDHTNTIIDMGKQALSDNAPRIAEARQ